MRFSQHDIDCIKAAKALVEANMSVHHTITTIASQIGIAPNKLKKGFSHLYGCGLFAHLRKVRLEAAKQLLAETDESIKIIAGLTGYGHAGNFSQAFTKVYDQSPTEYRAENNENYTALFLP